MKRFIIACALALASTLAFAQDPTPKVGGLIVNGVPMAFPASGDILGASEAATITGKSIDAGQLTGTINAARLPAPTASSLGGVQSYTGISHQWINSISTSGVPSSTQPAFSDISGQAALAQLPSISANSVLGNATGVSATPTALTTLPTGLTVPGATLSGTTTLSANAAGRVVTNSSGVIANSPAIDLFAFGAVTNGANTAIAVQNAVTAALSANLAIDAPCGTYTMGSTTITAAVPSGGVFVLRGSGDNCTKFSWATPTTGFVLNLADPTSTFHVRDLSALTGSASDTTTAFQVNQLAPPASPAGYPVSDFINITTRGADGYAQTDYWGYGISVNQASFINFENINDPGSNTRKGIGVFVAGNDTCTLTVGGCAVVFNFHNCTFSYNSTGIAIGTQVQGVTVDQSNFTGGNYGINVEAAANLGDQLSVTNSQFNEINDGIEILSPYGNVQVANNLFIIGSTGNGIDGKPSRFTAIGNQFSSSNGANAAINLATGAADAMISGNLVNGMAYGFVVNDTTIKANIQSNLYDTVTTPTTPATSTGNVVIGGGSK